MVNLNLGKTIVEPVHAADGTAGPDAGPLGDVLREFFVGHLLPCLQQAPMRATKNAGRSTMSFTAIRRPVKVNSITVIILQVHREKRIGPRPPAMCLLSMNHTDDGRHKQRNSNANLR